MQVLKAVRADKHWTDYSERIEEPLTRDSAWTICRIIRIYFSLAYEFENVLRALVTDIQKEQGHSARRDSLIRDALSYLMEKRRFLFSAFKGLLECPDNIIEEFCNTCKDDFAFGDNVRCHEWH
jgi:hypothetical protein